jgi:uncharacterized protein YjbJ (UPF0337 family)
MPRSARRHAANGVMDRIAGRMLEAWGTLTGRHSSRAKGGAARTRGRGRQTRSRVKRAAR